MSKVLVMYFSKYGTTKKYAQWLAAELNGDIYDLKKIKQDTLLNYNTIILGSALYAGKIEGLELIKNNFEEIKNKKIVIYTCGIADYSKTENINAIKERIVNALTKEITENIKIYFLRGGINYKKLNLLHKIMMYMLKKMIMKKDPEQFNEENKEFLETYGKIVDFTNKESINEIIKYCE